MKKRPTDSALEPKSGTVGLSGELEEMRSYV